MSEISNERAIRSVVATAVKAYANAFSDRHLLELNDPDGTINMKINNIFIAELGPEIQYFSALSRSLDSSLGNMLETMAIQIAQLHYTVSQSVVGNLYAEQTEAIALLLEKYKRHEKLPKVDDYAGTLLTCKRGGATMRRHEADYCLHDEETGEYHLIELKIGGDLDNKKARSEKEALLEQYCILSNTLDSSASVKLHFATAYNRYGEGKPWVQSRVLQFFAKDELLISRDFWNFICKSNHGYEIVLDEYKVNAHCIVSALNAIKRAYLPEE